MYHTALTGLGPLSPTTSRLVENEQELLLIPITSVFEHCRRARVIQLVVAQGESKPVLMDKLAFCCSRALNRLKPGTENSCCLSLSLLHSVYVCVK